MICGIILGVDVLPFLGVSVGSDYLYFVGDKRMESFGVAVYLTKYYLGIGPKELFKIGVV